MLIFNSVTSLTKRKLLALKVTSMWDVHYYTLLLYCYSDDNRHFCPWNVSDILGMWLHLCQNFEKMLFSVHIFTRLQSAVLMTGLLSYTIKWNIFKNMGAGMNFLEYLLQFALDPSNFSMCNVLDEELKEGISHGVKVLYKFPWGSETLETLWSLGDTLLQRTHQGTCTKLQVRANCV